MKTIISVVCKTSKGTELVTMKHNAQFDVIGLCNGFMSDDVCPVSDKPGIRQAMNSNFEITHGPVMCYPDGRVRRYPNFCSISGVKDSGVYTEQFIEHLQGSGFKKMTSLLHEELSNFCAVSFSD